MLRSQRNRTIDIPYHSGSHFSSNMLNSEEVCSRKPSSVWCCSCYCRSHQCSLLTLIPLTSQRKIPKHWSRMFTSNNQICLSFPNARAITQTSHKGVANQLVHSDNNNVKAPLIWHLLGEIHPHKWPVIQKAFPFHDVIMMIYMNGSLRTAYLSL